ncbi:MAG TPA: ABC transporter ATP-binding protein [Aestuariivirgaceae bacterium]|jgi:branched-chain amino acid transport system ATP-binding protein|nr:ABC transporter ATP-binding protein [Aestuariivirgaceae bacterium]
MLDVRSVSKRFGGAEVVAEVSLQVRAGEIAGLIGPNGAGKTTLFNLIAGSLRPTSGEIHIAGDEITDEKPFQRMARGLGRSFQIPRPFAEMTLLENMLTAAQGQLGERVISNWIVPRRVAREERANAEKALSLLQFLGLGRMAQDPARILSGGQRKLLELGRVLMADPKLILLDEPGAGVNPVLLDTIIDRIAEINRKGVTVFIIEHNMELVSRLCRHVFVMAGGRILFEGSPAAAVRDPSVIDAYLGGGSSE